MPHRKPIKAFVLIAALMAGITAASGSPQERPITTFPPQILMAEWVPPSDTSGMQPLPAVPESVIVQSGAGGRVTPGVTQPTTFQFDVPTMVTQVMTYHYGARKPPGMIAIQHEDGTLYGPWQAAGAVGQGNVPNAYWYVQPNVVFKPGCYTVIDSDPATWTHEDSTNGAGIIVIWGRPQ